MKKSLLLAALVASAMTANAATFTVLHNDNPVENGSFVICTDFEDYTDDGGENWGYDYEIKLMVNNTDMTAHEYTGTLLWSTYPTKEAYFAQKEELVEGTECTVWGTPQICNNQGLCFTPEGDSTLGQGDMTVSGMSKDGGFMYHLSSAPATLTSAYKTTIARADDPSDVFECTIVFAPTEEAAATFIANAGVNDIIAGEDGAPVYYNLNGMKVDNPSNGLYIVKRGAKVTKEIIR